MRTTIHKRMPYSVRQRPCQQADGSSGSYVVIKTNTREQVSCHDTRREAEQSRRIRKQRADDT